MAVIFENESLSQPMFYLIVTHNYKNGGKTENWSVHKSIPCHDEHSMFYSLILSVHSVVWGIGDWRREARLKNR
jgi:hypothetical protein